MTWRFLQYEWAAVFRMARIRGLSMSEVSDFSVSVILCTYNPDWRKLKATLLSAAMQENIDFEIVLTDDGSGEDHFREAAAL